MSRRRTERPAGMAGRKKDSIVSDSIKREDSRSGAAAPVTAKVLTPVLPGVCVGDVDSAGVIALRAADGATSLSNMILRDGTTQPADAEPRVGGGAPTPDAASDPIGQYGLSVVSGNRAEDDNRAGDAGDRRPDGGDGDRAVSDLMASLPWASRVSESDSPLDAMLSAFGHDRRCRRRVRSGLAVTCECSTRQPVDDAAVAIFLALRFARIGLSRRLPLPHGIVEQLARHVGEDDPAAIMVWDWLAQSGFVAARVLPGNTRQPALRLVCTEEKP